jgi:cyclohexanone monooxygenase
MTSVRARIAAFVVRRRVRPALGDLSDVGRIRKAFDISVQPPKGASYTPATLNGVPGERVEWPGRPARATMLYIHGGGFVGCSPRTHRAITASLARRGFRVFAPDYRLAPEHPYPAALDDVLASWRALVAGVDAGHAAVGGDSAGGNLALALMLKLREAGEPLPAGAALFSPATDLAEGGASRVENGRRDAMFDGESIHRFADMYLQGADPKDPWASPLFADLSGLPPLLLHAGQEEILRDDSVRLAHKAREAGVEVSLKLWPVVAHVWQMVWQLPEARQSLDAASAFLHAAVERAHAAAHPEAVEALDVVIVGAGLSGIGAAAHLQDSFPRRRYAILESRRAIGGTWDLFRYPGIRSDSDMYTLGYVFKPWRDPKAIADGPSIRAYVRETAAERGIEPHIRYGHRVVAAEWSTADARWLLQVLREDGRTVRIACNFLWMCSGYYSYTDPHRPAFPGEGRFRGTRVHPQFWPEGLDHAGKRVVVIGSGATAVTLVPEMAKTASQVTMLQRSPSYVLTLPASDPVARRLRWLPAMWAYRIVRAKNVLLSLLFFRLARRYPQRIKRRLIGFAARQLPRGYDVGTHFNPRYHPWDQRLCVVPDGDLFQAIRKGAASVVTGEIETFTETGIRLKSGEELPADIVVTATGLRMQILGGAQVAVDGRRLEPSDTLVYKGMMYSGVPNMVTTFGYTNASWTLKADLTARYACRLLGYMDRHGFRMAVPRRDPSVQEEPFLDFSSGYVQRAIASLPRQGDRKPWKLYQNYLLDFATLRWSRIDDGVLTFSRGGA